MLLKKLHLKPGMKFAVAEAPDGFAETLGKLPEGLTQAKSLAGELDTVILFARNQRALQDKWSKALAVLRPEGALWVCYPKKSSGIQTDLGMGEWDAAKGSGWNPVAMIAVDATWSAVRFRHSPGLEQAREASQDEALLDTDGTVCVDRKRRVITPPADLRKILARNAKANAFFETLSFTNRREYVSWIIGAKRPETRAARVEKTVGLLTRGKKNPTEK